MNKIISFLILSCLISCQPTFAMRPVNARQSFFIDKFKKAQAARQELRTKNISIMDIHFGESFKENVLAYFRDLGFAIERYSHENAPRDVHRKFDLVFWKIANPSGLDGQLLNVVELLRQDGILFAEVMDEAMALDVQTYATVNQLSWHRVGKTFVLKRMFDDYTFFMPIVNDIKAMMETQEAA